MTDAERNLIQRLADALDCHWRLLRDDNRETHPLAAEARFHLAQSVPEPATDEELLELMPEQLREDLAEASRICAIHAGCEPGPIRVTLNTGIAEHCRAVLARWGRPVTTQEAS